MVLLIIISNLKLKKILKYKIKIARGESSIFFPSID